MIGPRWFVGVSGGKLLFISEAKEMVVPSWTFKRLPGQQPFPSSWSGLEGFRRLDSLEPVSGGNRRSGLQLEQSS